MSPFRRYRNRGATGHKRGKQGKLRCDEQLTARQCCRAAQSVLQSTSSPCAACRDQSVLVKQHHAAPPTATGSRARPQQRAVGDRSSFAGLVHTDMHRRNARHHYCFNWILAVQLSAHCQGGHSLLKQRRAATPAASGSTHSRSSAQQMTGGGGMWSPVGSIGVSRGPAMSGSVSTARTLVPTAASSATAVLPPARCAGRARIGQEAGSAGK